MSIRIIVKAVVLHKNNTGTYVLLLKRAAHVAVFPDRDDLAGGKIEPGETMQQAIVREIYEETGLVVTAHDAQMLCSYEWYNSSGVHCKEYLFATYVNTQEVTLNDSEHSSYAWACLHEVQNSSLHETIKQKIHELMLNGLC